MCRDLHRHYHEILVFQRFFLTIGLQMPLMEVLASKYSRTAHLLLPAVIEQQAERLRTVRQAATQGMLSSYTILLLADIQTLHNKGKIQ